MSDPTGSEPPSHLRPPESHSGGNRLRHETSPYLLQHAENPVDWYPWGPEALERARREDKPIFLSVGYSSCHWCHVMEHESFQDPEVAALMNEHFVNIKVDREERPDLDEIYMTSCHLLNGSGGWPLSVWMTPDLRPFFAGTYFPPQGRWRRPGFVQVLTRLASYYQDERENLEERAEALTQAIRKESGLIGGGPEGVDPDQLERTLRAQKERFDPGPGGFGHAPKFPPFFALELLLRRLERDPEAPDPIRRMVEETLEGMAHGGIHDQLGGGFHRYSTDDHWLVPHFEKMLTDNALLVPLYLRAASCLGRSDFARVAERVLEWCTREMRAPEGGFYSSQDADSEGVEGKFFAWTPEQLEEALPDPEDLRLAAAYLDVTEKGNWSELMGHSILHVSLPEEEAAEVLEFSPEEFRERLGRVREQLFEARSRRVAPATDRKILTSWNGLMLSAYARAAPALEIPELLEVATGAACFAREVLLGADGLRRTALGRDARLQAYQEDHAYLAQGFLDLFEATADPEWLELARDLTDSMVENFWDPEEKGFFFTAHDHEELLARTKNPMDNATPSGNSVAVHVLLRLAHLTGDPGYRERAEETLSAFGPGMRQYPMGFQNMTAALERSQRPPSEWILLGDPEEGTVRELARRGREALGPDALVLVLDPRRSDLERLRQALPLLAGKETGPGGFRAYLCQDGSCRPPADSPEEARELLELP